MREPVRDKGRLEQEDIPVLKKQLLSILENL